MRTWMLVLAFAAAALPAPAAQRMTVAEIEQFLNAEYAAHKSDGSIAGRLAEVELSEQLTGPTLDRITGDLKPGTKTAQALHLLLDTSAFLEPPAGEIPGKPAPEMAEQVRLVQGAVNFAGVTIEQLPNFLATRTTHAYDNSVFAMSTDASRAGFVVGKGLHENGEYSRQITYRAGAEVASEATADSGKRKKLDTTPPGLSSSGEFGPFLQVVLRDSAKGQMTWSHWEQTRYGMAAVFKYEVPEEASHYSVDYCCVLFTSRPPTAGRVQITKGPGVSSGIHAMPGYHGSLYLDSETGAVMRVTLEAEMHSGNLMTRVAVWVEYGTTQIGDRNYLCPARSMAYMAQRTAQGDGPEWVQMNEVTFSNYRRFGSTARILSVTPEP